MRRTLTTALLALSLAALALGAPGTALARSHSCPRHHGQLAGDSFGNVWHHGSSLWGCTTVYDHPPRAKELGPWNVHTKLVWDGVTAVWTVPQASGDRVWAVNVDSRERWLRGTRILPVGAGQSFADGRVQRLLMFDQAAAWVTTGGQLVFAMHSPNDTATALGALPAPLVQVKQLLLVGTFTSVSPAALAASAKLKETEGDGDECGGDNTYQLTVQLGSAQPRVGAEWDGDWTSTNCS